MCYTHGMRRTSRRGRTGLTGRQSTPSRQRPRPPGTTRRSSAAVPAGHRSVAELADAYLRRYAQGYGPAGELPLDTRPYRLTTHPLHAQVAR